MLYSVSSLSSQDGTLNAAVALAAGLIWQAGAWYRPASPTCAAWRFADWNPCADESQAAPLLDAARISTTINHAGVWLAFDAFNYDDEPLHMMPGLTRREAGLRTLVARRFGAVIEMPEALVRDLRLPVTRIKVAPAHGADAGVAGPVEACSATRLLDRWRLDGIAESLREISRMLGALPEAVRGNSVVHYCAHRASALAQEIAR